MIKNIKTILVGLAIVIIAGSCQKETTVSPVMDENSAALFTTGKMETVVEDFESGVKESPSNASVTLTKGSWQFSNATIVSSGSGKVAHLNPAGTLAMNYDFTNGVSGVLIDYANAGNGNSTFELWVSTNGGSSWEKTGDAITSSSSTMHNTAFYMDYHGSVRLQIKNTGEGELNIDNFTVQDNSAVATRDNNIALGNPSNAVANSNSPNNYLCVKPQYTLGYNSSKGNPKWVSWHLSTAWKGNAPRVDCFRGDETLPSTCYKTTAANYNNIGFDRGHQCPSDDRDGSSADNKNTFYMTDMLPQAPNLNRITWLALEDYCRTLASQGNELYIISGGYGSGGTGSNGGVTTTVANGKVEVPSRCWKVIVVLTNGSNDKNRITNSTRVIAVDMPNKQTVSSQTWGSYRVSVDAIEAATGLNLLSSVATAVQNNREAIVDNGPTQ
ncbi:MAG: DNA/RNA non-specific endonuclease [Bacteroidia bacterium]